MDMFNKCDAVQVSFFKIYQGYKCSHSCAFLIVQHLSSNMRPHNTPSSSSNQYLQQSSLSSLDFSGYVDHSDQPVGYHPVGRSAKAQVQGPTHGHIQDPHHPGTRNPLLRPVPTFSAYMITNSYRLRQPRGTAERPYRPTTTSKIILESSVFLSALCVRCASCREGISESRHSCPLSKLPPDR